MTQASDSTVRWLIALRRSYLCSHARWAAIALAAAVAACGGGGSNTVDPAMPAMPPADPVVQGPHVELAAPQTVAGSNRIALQWTARGEALVFSVLVKRNDREAFAAVAEGLSGSSTVIDRGYAWKLDFPTASVKVRGCTPGNLCVDSNEQPLLRTLMAGVIALQSALPDASWTDPNMPGIWALIGLGMAFNSNGDRLLATGDTFYEFNRSAAGLWTRMPVQVKGGGQAFLSDDGSTMVTAAADELGTFGGIDPPPGPDGGTRDDSPFVGAVYVYVRSGQGQWQQQAHIRADSRLFSESFGSATAMSGNGNTLAVATSRARVFMLSRDAMGTWHQDTILGYPSEQPGSDRVDFQAAVALSHDGRIVAIQAAHQFEQDNLLIVDRFVEVYEKQVQGGWVRQARLPSRRQFILDVDDFFGNSIALDDDGSTIAVGAPEDDSDDTDTVGDPTNHKARMSGAVYIFRRIGTSATWTQQAFLKARQAAPRDNFGRRVFLSRDGRVMLGQALGWAANVPGINRNNEAERVAGIPPGDDGSGGAAYIFETCDCGSWHQRATTIPPTQGTASQTDLNVALSGDGKTYAIAANAFERVNGVTTQHMRIFAY